MKTSPIPSRATRARIAPWVLAALALLPLLVFLTSRWGAFVALVFIAGMFAGAYGARTWPEGTGVER